MDQGTLKIAARVAIACGLLLAGISSSCGLSARAQSNLPNIVYILADDMGIGDIRSYNPNSPVNTPNLDRIANAGMRFTNAHSSSSVCSPTRYSLLTGRYAWRGALQSDVVRIYGPPIVEPSRLTAAEMLQEAGYSTGAFGKWHLGAQWVTTNGGPAATNGSNVDHSQPFTGGPIDHGFDTYFGIDGSANFPPYAYIQDDRTVGIPTGQVRGNPQNPVNWPGPIVPGFDIAELVPTMMEAGATFIREKSNDANPFFAYFPLTAPHEPVVPPGFLVGSSGVTGPRAAYGDFVATVDWAVGRVLDALEDPNNDNDTSDSVLDETVIMFAADNGAETNVSFATSPGYIDGQLMRGRKQTIYEGGHRVPFLAQWNGHIPAGSVSSQVVELNDFMATAAQIVDYDLPENAAEDSYDLTPALFGQATAPLRDYSVQHSAKGAFTIRHVDEAANEWKLIFTPNDGGLGGTAGLNPLDDITDFSQLQMYNLKNDPREAANLLAGGGTPEMRTRALEMQTVMRSYMTDGRSAPMGAGGEEEDRTIRIDYGPNFQRTLATGWNNVTGAAGSEPVVNITLNDTEGASTGIVLRTQWSEMTDHTGVNGSAANYNGPYPSALAGLPTSALQDGVYVRDGAMLSMELSNLNADHVYDFVFYGAAENTGDRSLFTVTGSTTKEAHISPLVRNATQVATILGINPDATREINIRFEGRLENGSVHLPNVAGDAQGRLNFLQIVERLMPLRGDYNGDNFVNNLDYNVWRARFGTTDLAADGNADGRVDAADFVVWRKNFGAQRTGAASGSTQIETASAVPEPAAWVTLMLGLAASQAHRARRSHNRYRAPF